MASNSRGFECKQPGNRRQPTSIRHQYAAHDSKSDRDSNKTIKDSKAVHEKRWQEANKMPSHDALKRED